MRRVIVAAAVVLTVFGCGSLRARQTSAPSTATSSSPKQSETDEYTRYELLAPESASFKIYYEVTATTPGAKYFYNPIRKGSAASDEAVFDSMTGDPLPFEVVSGGDARKDPLMSDADADTNFIKISLARPVPADGQGRVLILKTYKDTASSEIRLSYQRATSWLAATCHRKSCPSPTAASQFPSSTPAQAKRP
jgi:hypothetical protein